MSTSNVDQLLAQRVWLRRLAVALVGDSQADDIVQQTVATALASPPRDADRLRGWLARVARNLAWKHLRGERRRSAREADAAQDEALSPPEELLARIEEQHVVARAVTALDEPYRSTLLWRYYEDLSTAEIARRAGQPESTVRTRIQRGLESVRARLEAERGPDWRLAVLPLLHSQPTVAGAASAGSATTLGGLLMTTNGKLALVGTALVAALVVALRIGMAAPPEEMNAARPLEPTERVALDETRERSVGLDGPRAELEHEPAAPSAAAPIATVRGVVLDTTGQPLSGVPLYAQPSASGSAPRAVGTSDPSGVFEFDWSAREADGDVLTCGAGYFTLYSAVVDSAALSGTELFVVAAPEVRRTGHVLDHNGAPLEGVRVDFEWWSLASFPRELGSVRANRLPRARTDEHGFFELESCPGTEQLELHFRLEGYAEERVACSPRDQLGLDVTLELHFAGAEGFRALVVDESGTSLPGARVSCGGVEKLTDECGEVELPWMRSSGALIAVLAGKELFVRAGFGHEAWVADGSPEPVEVVLVEPHLRIVGHVFDARGRAAADVPVTIERGTPLGGGEFAEFVAQDRDGLQTLELTRTDANGRFELQGLANKNYVVSAYDALTYECVRATARAGTEGLSLQFASSGVIHEVEAVCVDGEGRPLAGLEVGLMLQVTYGRDGQLRRPGLATTDAEGRFELDAVPVGSAFVTFKGPQIIDAFQRVDTEDVARTGPLRFVLERASSVRFVPSGLEAEGCHAGLMGADGTITTLWVHAKDNRMFDLTWEIAQGTSPIYRVDAGEYTLFVTRAGEFLREESVRIHSGELNEIAVP